MRTPSLDDMRLTPAKKVVLIFALTLLALVVVLPKSIPINISFGGINIQKTLERKDLGIQVGRIKLGEDIPLVLGLDLAGGSHIVFEADTSKVPEEAQDQVLEGLKEVIERRVNLFGISEPNVTTSVFEGKKRVIVELPGVKDTASAVELIGQTASLNFVEVPEDQEALYKETDLGGSDLKIARVVFEPTTGQPAVSIEFNEEGAKKFETITERNVGKPLAILLDGALVQAPFVQEKITGGVAMITGGYTTADAERLAIQLNAGALPVPVKIVEERTVGATLGQDSINKSIDAGIVGLSMVAIFMIISYRRLGIVACLTLVVFAILTLAVYKIVPIVLTLPGIAGFLLSVGMAVDSNILIFERFKEEIKKRDTGSALEISFGRAWDSIRDANIATLVTAFILANPLDFSFLHTSGPVRGFAITLTIGILISLFTGIVVTRNLLRLLLVRK